MTKPGVGMCATLLGLGATLPVSSYWNVGFDPSFGFLDSPIAGLPEIWCALTIHSPSSEMSSPTGSTGG